MYDNAPLVVREAAAMATPSLLPAGSTASEVMTDRFNGFIVGAPDARSYADALPALDADRESVVRAGRGARATPARTWVVEADRLDVAIAQPSEFSDSHATPFLKLLDPCIDYRLSNGAIVRRATPARIVGALTFSRQFLFLQGTVNDRD